MNITVIFCLYSFWVVFVSADVDLHLETGMQMLLKGQLNDALSHYHLAVGM